MKEISEWFLAERLRIRSLSRDIWEHPEISEHENHAASVLGKALSEGGFTLTSGVAGLPTAFSAAWGRGSPKIGFLAEYDALPGLSQEALSRRKPRESQEAGHGCGHNLLGAGAAAAALALKDLMERRGMEGTIVVYGCPSEEIMLGKIIMASQGIFDDLDVAFSWHPGDLNCASEMSYQAMLSVDYSFTGKASHAAMAPQEGLSALDAVELMDVGANYLREHLPSGGQIHYVITGGGDKPNIVPEKASVWYFIRANNTRNLEKIAARLSDIARGAALMTGTEVSSSIRTGCHETRIVPALVSLLDEVMAAEVPPPHWSEEEISFAKDLVSNLGIDPSPEGPLYSGISRSSGRVVEILGSSDLSDVSWIVPTCMLFAACYPKGTPNHTWGVTACSGMEIGEKGMLYAAEVLASSAYRVLTSPALLRDIRDSFSRVSGKEAYRALFTEIAR